MNTLPPAYRLFLIGNGISQLGDWLRVMAINWLIVNELSKTSVEGNLNRLIVAIATILFSVVASLGLRSKLCGKPRTALRAKTVVLFGAAWSMLMSIVLSVLVGLELLSLDGLIALGVAGAIVTVLVGPSGALLDRELAGTQQLQAALRRDQIMFLMRALVGVASGAVLLHGTWLLLAIDAVTFIPLICILAYLRRAHPAPAGEVDSPIDASLFRGLGIVFSNAGLLVAFGLAVVRDAFVAIGFSLTAEIVKVDLKANGLAYGSWLSITGVAGVLGSIIYERMGHGTLAKRLRVYAFCVCGVPLAMICAGHSPSLTPYVAFYAVFVFLVSPTDSTFKALIRGLPQEQIGRVDRVYLVLQSGLTPRLWYAVTKLAQSAGVSPQQTLATSATLGLGCTLVLLAIGFTIARKSFVKLFEEVD